MHSFREGKANFASLPIFRTAMIFGFIHAAITVFFVYFHTFLSRQTVTLERCMRSKAPAFQRKHRWKAVIASGQTIMKVCRSAT